jgi:hypothetical protein
MDPSSPKLYSPRVSDPVPTPTDDERVDQARLGPVSGERSTTMDIGSRAARAPEFG